MKTSQFFFQKMQKYYTSVVMSPTYNGQVIQECDDISMLRDAFHLWILTMWDFAHPSDCNRLYDTLPQLFLKLAGCDIRLLVGQLDRIRSEIYNLPSNSSIVLSAFKGQHLGGSLYSGHILVPMQRFGDASDHGSLKVLNTLLCFLLKLNIKLDLGDSLEEEYVRDEDRLRHLSIPESICSDLNKIIRKWFSDWKMDEVYNPRHGPGAIASKGRIPISTKYKMLGLDMRLSYFLSRDRKAFEKDYVRPLAPLSRTSEVLFVPKSLKTYRVICKEPATLQYWQQFVSSSLVDYVHHHPYLHKKIRLDDQSLSRSFCLQASASRQFATIDLSKASDTVSLQLVKKIFRGTALLRALVATRSDSVLLPSGKVVRTAKFAPMGSALCFPVECIIFAALCELAIAYSSSTNSRYRVYGDDIIIHHSHVPNLLSLLDQTGFLPNREKSYWSPNIPYRESCGVEAHDGRDISPLRLSRWFIGYSTKKDSNIMRLVDLANAFFENGCYTARKAVVQSLVKANPPPLFTVPYGIGLWSTCPTNFHLKRRKRDGQVWILHGSLISKSVPCKLQNEDIRLHEWFRTDGNPDGTIVIEKTHVVWQATASPSWFTMIEVAGE